MATTAARQLSHRRLWRDQPLLHWWEETRLFHRVQWKQKLWPSNSIPIINPRRKNRHLQIVTLVGCQQNSKSKLKSEIAPIYIQVNDEQTVLSPCDNSKQKPAVLKRLLHQLMQSDASVWIASFHVYVKIENSLVNKIDIAMEAVGVTGKRHTNLSKETKIVIHSMFWGLGNWTQDHGVCQGSTLLLGYLLSSTANILSGM